MKEKSKECTLRKTNIIRNMKKKIKKFNINKGMTLAEILKINPEVVKILLKKKMYCIGCPSAMHETLEQGAIMHGLDADKLVKELNKKIGREKK